MNPIDAYAAAVVDGLVPAGKYHRLACVRHQRDRAREGTPDFPYRFDLARAERFFRFVGPPEALQGRVGRAAHRRCSPISSSGSGPSSAGCMSTTGLRRFRTSYHEIPRKNGKSLEAAVVALYLTFFDGEAGAEGYTIATKRDQARIVWGDARQLVLVERPQGQDRRPGGQPARRRDRVEARAARRRPRLHRRPEPVAHHRRRVPRPQDARPHRRHGDGDRAPAGSRTTSRSPRPAMTPSALAATSTTTPARSSTASWSTRASSRSSRTRTSRTTGSTRRPGGRRTRTMACR